MMTGTSIFNVEKIEIMPLRDLGTQHGYVRDVVITTSDGSRVTITSFADDPAHLIIDPLEASPASGQTPEPDVTPHPATPNSNAEPGSGPLNTAGGIEQ